MQQRSRKSLAEYAARRYRLAGSKKLLADNPFFRIFDAAGGDSGDAGSRPLSFAHYDYLGLGEEPAVRRAAADATLAFGTGVGASRLVGGERSFHDDLERRLADFVGTDGALTMVSGYGTNTSVISHLLVRGDVIFYDALAHNSIVAGARGTRAASIAFDHNSMDHLETLLKEKRGSFERALVITEGLFSMDGDIPDLPRLLELCRRYDAWLMLDEAHSIGVLGKTGRGLTEHFGIPAGEIDVIVGTMSKAFASCGGFICASAETITWLRYTLPGFIFSVGLAPGVAGGVTVALETLRAQPGRVERANAMSRYFLDVARRSGFDVGSAIGAGVVPIMLADNEQTLSAAEWLFRKGIYVPPIVHIGVPKELPRLRFFITASHTQADIERAIGALVEWREAGDVQFAAE